jgi:hypothetical protein
MAAIQILPGEGSRYLSEVFSALPSGNVNADELIISQCSELEIQQIVKGSPGGTFQPQERTSSLATWVSLGSTITVGDGTVTKFTSTSRPFSRLRFLLTSVTGLDANDTLQLIVQGYGVGGARF